MTIWYILGSFGYILVSCTKKNLASLQMGVHWEKIAQNVVQSYFLTKINMKPRSVEKKEPKIFGCFRNKKTAKRKQSSKRRKFAQSGRPAVSAITR
jgi:hypothetical protein